MNLDERTNTLIIKDISSVIDEATALISAIDTQTPQVMIEAKIVEANLDFSRELGAVWSIQTNQFENAFDPDTLRFTHVWKGDFVKFQPNRWGIGGGFTPGGEVVLSGLPLVPEV